MINVGGGLHFDRSPPRACQLRDWGSGGVSTDCFLLPDCLLLVRWQRNEASPVQHVPEGAGLEHLPSPSSRQVARRNCLGHRRGEDFPTSQLMGRQHSEALGRRHRLGRHRRRRATRARRSGSNRQPLESAGPRCCDEPSKTRT